MSIVAWPEAPYIDDGDDDWLAYERARADAAMARLKVAVEYMRGTYMHGCDNSTLEEALALIGDLP